ncbi:E3 ubiquitin-protein ligase RNF25 isoform X2 [Eurytemora carolleeae]|uniref:E3 ubiquitin-protein ligase RNF25 isoform X2 n=1 Tax=Eurytemora carolleeae TaxID=1294199 RepID=UPI000C7642DC|nr:E3 ubiquitin-protein ligase RNF25 isoform X2 [Eurytemora carolleeae]|eukprot:XP_023348078.1 E3 ubiquitin-protein ligase RNF25-like isoform X2 [Eurytemora affinis]
MCSEEALEEIEALIAILEEDTVEILKDDNIIRELNVRLSPLTASEQEKQYVSLTLSIIVGPEYPSTVPKLEMKNPRGLDESAVNTLLKQMKLRCEEYIGSPVFFELIELGREFLSERNVPVCQCIICLNNIQEDDQFLKTECLHFFHKHCLGRYITSSQRGYEEDRREAERQNKHTTIMQFILTCPVCRENIGESRYNLAELLAAVPPILGAEELKISIGEEVKELQRQMADLFLKQKEKGGIIDLEEEGRKYLVLTGSTESGEMGQLSPTDFSDERLPGINSQRSTPTLSPQDSPGHSYAYNKFDKGRGGRGQGWRGRGGGGRGHPVERGKSHNQQRKTKGRGGGEEGRGRGEDGRGRVETGSGRDSGRARVEDGGQRGNDRRKGEDAQKPGSGRGGRGERQEKLQHL